MFDANLGRRPRLSLNLGVIESAITMTGVQKKERDSGKDPVGPDWVDLSLVIPVFNEVDNLRPLVEEISAALSHTSLSYEILFVDDGSNDGSFELMEMLHEEYPAVGAIRFRRNFGQTAAFSAGFNRIRGAIVVTLDADRQNDPADIPLLIEKLNEGFDVVNGWRLNRKDTFLFRKVPSYLANKIIATASGVSLHDRGCSLRAFRSEVVSELRLYGEMHRFIPELANAAGFTMAEVPVNHRSRAAGESKYGISRTYRVILDLMTIMFLERFGARPMHLFGGVGIIACVVGILTGLYLTGTKVIAGLQDGLEGFHSVKIGDRPLLMLAILLIILGTQFFVMGLLAELVVRTYHESQGKPTYYIRQVIESERFQDPIKPGQAISVPAAET